MFQFNAYCVGNLPDLHHDFKSSDCQAHSVKVQIIFDQYA